MTFVVTCRQMKMDDDLVDFIREHKARMAEDKQDPPYMEIKVGLNSLCTFISYEMVNFEIFIVLYMSICNCQAKPHRTYWSNVKENIPPKPFAQDKGIINVFFFV